MKAQGLEEEKRTYNQERKVKNGLLNQLNTILKSNIDSIRDLEEFLQKIVEASANVVYAHSSKLVLFNERKMKGPSSLIEQEKISRTSNSINIPLILRGLDHPMGYIEVESRIDGKPFDLRDEVSLLMMGRQATLKIENDLFYREIYENMIEVLKSMVNIIESRDPYIHCHSSRVTNYALKIAEELDLSVQEMDIMRLACLLHDIGKIGIPDSILIKKGNLTPEEWDIIQTHSLIGENIVKPLGFLSKEGQIIRTHHECYDGSGYPDGLRGEEIPLSARIIAVADSYDAMTMERPYRTAKTPVQTMNEIEKLQSVKYDPYVVKAFRRCFDRQL